MTGTYKFILIHKMKLAWKRFKYAAKSVLDPCKGRKFMPEYEQQVRNTGSNPLDYIETALRTA